MNANDSRRITFMNYTALENLCINKFSQKYDENWMYWSHTHKTSVLRLSYQCKCIRFSLQLRICISLPRVCVCVCMRVLSLPTFHTHIQCGHFTVLLVRVEQIKMCHCIVKRMAIHRNSKAINNPLAHINETETKCFFFHWNSVGLRQNCSVSIAIKQNRIKNVGFECLLRL